MSSQGALALNRRRHRVGSAAESDEEGVALRVDLLATMRGEHLPEQSLLVGQQLAVGLAAQPLEQPRRALDVREQEGDGAAQTLRREPPCAQGSLPAGFVSNSSALDRPVQSCLASP